MGQEILLLFSCLSASRRCLIETWLCLLRRESALWQLQPKGSDRKMPSRESQLAWTAAPLCLVPSGMCGFSKWQHWACPVPSGAPGLLSLQAGSFPGLKDRTGWALIVHKGKRAGWLEGDKCAVLTGFIPAGFEFSYHRVSLLEFYCLLVWEFGQRSQW